MEPNSQKMNKSYLILGGVISILIIVIVVMLVRSNSSSKAAADATPTPTEEVEEVIPTVGPGVKVDVEMAANKREMTLSIDGIPEGTESIEYIVSYDTAEQGIQGLNSIIEVEEGEDSIEKELTVGTCSSGTCVYHDVVGEIKVELKFSGSYGEQIFQKDYDL